MKPDNSLILGALGIAVIYFAVLKPITDKLGLTDSDKAKREQEAAEEAGRNQGWNPNFYKQRAPYAHRLFAASAATAQARQIGNAWGKFNDDEQAIYAVFRRLQSRAQLSQLVDAYSTLYKQDLLTRLKAPWYYLNEGFDVDELKEVYNIVNKLPLYLKA